MKNQGKPVCKKSGNKYQYFQYLLKSYAIIDSGLTEESLDSEIYIYIYIQFLLKHA